MKEPMPQLVPVLAVVGIMAIYFLLLHPTPNTAFHVEPAFLPGLCVAEADKDLWELKSYHRIKKMGRFSYKTEEHYLTYGSKAVSDIRYSMQRYYAVTDCHALADEAETRLVERHREE